MNRGRAVVAVTALVVGLGATVAAAAAITTPATDCTVGKETTTVTATGVTTTGALRCVTTGLPPQPTVTVTVTPSPSASSSPTGFPNATTTGLTDPTLLKPSGCVTASTPGQVVQNLTITDCDISVTATDVTIRNVRLVSSTNDKWGIIVRGGASATIDHVEVSGKDKTTGSVEYAVLSQTNLPTTVSNSNLHHCADCIQGENMTITGNYIHDMALIPGVSHVDGIQCNAYCGLTIRGNTILNEYGQTSAVALFADFGTPKDSTITGNLLAGGGWTIYAGNAASTGISVTNNVLSRRYWPNVGQWGWLTRGGGSPVVSGNTYEDGSPAT